MYANGHGSSSLLSFDSTKKVHYKQKNNRQKNNPNLVKNKIRIVHAYCLFKITTPHGASLSFKSLYSPLDSVMYSYLNQNF